MADYVTVEEIKADIPDSPLFDVTDSTYDTVLGNMVTAASRLIDHVSHWRINGRLCDSRRDKSGHS